MKGFDPLLDSSSDNVFEPLHADDGALADSIGQIIGTGPGRGIGLMHIVGGAALVVASLSAFAIRPLRNVEAEIPDVLQQSAFLGNRGPFRARGSSYRELHRVRLRRTRRHI